MLVFTTSYHFIPVFKLYVYHLFIQCAGGWLQCVLRSLLLRWSKTIWDCRWSFWPTSRGWRIKIFYFLHQTALALMLMTHNSHLRLVSAYTNSLTWLVFFPHLKQPRFSLLPCYNSAEPPQSCHALELLMCRNGVQTTFQSHLLPAWLVHVCPVQLRIQRDALPGLVSTRFYLSWKIAGAVFCDICLLLPGTLE